MNVSRNAIEAAINRCKSVEGTDGCTLPADVRALADVWGNMIYHRLEEVPEDTLSEKARAALKRWSV